MRARRRSLATLAVGALIGSGAVAAQGAVVVPDGGFVLQGSTADIKRSIDLAHAAGARWVSLSASWEALEPQPEGYLVPGTTGAAAWADLADRLAYAKARGMSVELRLNNAPAWASGREGRSDDPPTPQNAGAYGEFLADLATRLGPYIDAYTPWNEPNLSHFWNPVSPEAYTAVQKVAYASIKPADPSATVLSAAIVGRYNETNTGYGYLRRAYQAGLAGSVDAIAWNGYPGGEPESPGPVEGGVPSASTLPGQLYLRDLINQFDPGRKVWIMETGWSTCVRCNVSGANSATEAQQADYVRRAFEYRRRYLADVTERIFWYQLRDEGSDPNNWFHRQGVVRRDFSPKPAYSAFRSMGVEVPDGAPSDSIPLPVGPGATPSAMLPPKAARLDIPHTARSPRGRVTLGRPRLSARRGALTLALKVVVRGGTSRIRIEGFRARRWRHVTTVRLRRSGTLRIRFRDKAYLGVRIRGTVPGRKGFRVGRVVRLARAPRAARSMLSLGLPASTRAGARRRVSIGPLLVVRSGSFVVVKVRTTARGGTSRVRLDVLRGRRWVGVRTTTVTRSRLIRVRLRGSNATAVRVRATLPRSRGYKVGRVARVST